LGSVSHRADSAQIPISGICPSGQPGAFELISKRFFEASDPRVDLPSQLDSA
jgi:hypothetical protein